MANPPAETLNIYVVGKQWMWKVQHTTGQREINQLHVPVGRPVKLIMTSEDVIHNFSIPALRVKADVIPGRFVQIWFEPTKPGTYQIFCAEYCGTQHSGMIGQVVVMEPTAYQTWLSGGAPEGSLASTGEKLFADLACNTCHRPDSRGRGPVLQNVFGHPVQLHDGSVVTADENYLRESILTPAAKMTAGFQPVMPAFQGLVSEEQLLALIEYIKSLSAPAAADTARTIMAVRISRSSLSERRLRHHVVAADARSQAHRAALSGRGHVVLLHRRRLRGAHPARSRDARRRSRQRRHLQRALHHARHRHGVLLPDSGDPGRFSATSSCRCRSARRISRFRS